MKRFEIILGVIFVIALMLKLAVFPGGGTLATFSLLLLACLYYFFGFAFFNKIKLRDIFKKGSYKGMSAWRIIGSIGAGMGLSTICVGILFKIQHWPGRHIFLYVGLISIFFIAVVALVKFFQSNDSFYKMILSRIAIIGGLGLLLNFTPDLTLTKILFRNHPDYVKAYERYLDDPQSEEAKRQLDIEYNKAMFPEEEYQQESR